MVFNGGCATLRGAAWRYAALRGATRHGATLRGAARACGHGRVRCATRGRVWADSAFLVKGL
jgi:hypothetical protein